MESWNFRAKVMRKERELIFMEPGSVRRYFPHAHGFFDSIYESGDMGPQGAGRELIKPGLLMGR